MILCLGTAPTAQRTMTFPSLTLDHVNRASCVLDSASGKSINVARVLHTLGHEVLATGFLGGPTGNAILADLTQSNIPHDFVLVPQNTRTCTTIINLSTSHATELVEEHAPIHGEHWQQLTTKLHTIIPQSQIVVLSGSLPPNSPQDFYATCMSIANQHYIPVILDARGTSLKFAMPLRPLLVKPNRAELAETVGFPINTQADLEKAIQQLLQQGPQWALITHGPHPATLSNGRQTWQLTPPRITSVNPIGSGDAVAAGIAAALTKNQPLPEAARLGIACAVANALTQLPGHLNPEDVQRLLPQIPLMPV